MLSVLGAGLYLPQTVISNSWLKSLGNSSSSDAEAIDALALQTGIMSRRASLLRMLPVGSTRAGLRTGRSTITAPAATSAS